MEDTRVDSPAAMVPGGLGLPQPPLAADPPKSQQPAQAAVSAPHIADDVDLIEKEWVGKIGEIIQKTHGDPFERARQMALLKNEYLQKRYQKTIKMT